MDFYVASTLSDSVAFLPALLWAVREMWRWRASRVRSSLPAVPLLFIVALMVIGVGASSIELFFRSKGRSNLVFFHVFTLCEHLLLMSAISFWISNRSLRQLMRWGLIPAFVILWSVAKWSGLEKFDQLDHLTLPISSLIISFFAIHAVMDINERTTTPVGRDPVFFVLVGFSSYFLGNLLIFILYGIQIMELWTIHAAVNIMKNACITYAFYLLVRFGTEFPVWIRKPG